MTPSFATSVDDINSQSYPKGKVPHRDILYKAMKSLGFEGMSLIAVDDTWSAMRFKRE